MVDNMLEDTQLLGRPKGYAGNKEEFANFKYQLVSYLGAVDPTLAEAAQMATQHDGIIQLAALAEPRQKHARTLSYLGEEHRGGQRPRAVEEAVLARGSGERDHRCCDVGVADRHELQWPLGDVHRRALGLHAGDITISDEVR